MMLLFRPTFITAVVAFVAVLSTFVASASAAPQFGRPLLHVMDELSASLTATSVSSTATSTVVTLISSSTVDIDPAPVPTAAADPGPDLSGSQGGSDSVADVMNNVQPTSPSTPAVANTNSASSRLSGGSTGLGLVVALVVYFFISL
ncbi:hypothetical protein BJ138DRAFT_102242 [Hygrophoropsis aurantiaca]|uniref:Uncharacterized protein n=1 Tax=Hygrophoropsis aurantiaca TaxID=72124 RepID=A0ACB7ZRH1_9AGAM|nr:hypothetical protein BJ138DRAFT_102242 [Hygrophoropsis aurantiaca]